MAINEYQATKPKQHSVGMTVEWPNGDNDELFASDADCIVPNAYYDPPPADGSKVIIADTDHIWGIGGDRTWVNLAELYPRYQSYLHGRL